MTPVFAVPNSAPGSPPAHIAEISAWLEEIGARRNLGLPSPSDHPYAAVLGSLLDTLADEFGAYRDVVNGARDAARRNAEQLSSVVRSTVEQGELVRATAAAAAEAGTGAQRIVTAAGALREYAEGAATSATAADAGLAEMGMALGELEGRLDEGKTPLTQMRASTSGVADFLVTLARLSRHAQLLAVNASIEAAHLAEAGTRFAIVAHEVRKLSTSTRSSRTDVARIVGELRESTGQVATAAGDSADATLAAAREIEGAAEALSETGRGITRFEQMVVNVADVAATQRTALEAIASSIDAIAQHADEAADASRDAGRLDLEALLANAEAKTNLWTLRTVRSRQVANDDAFAAWIGAIIGGTDMTAAADVDADPSLARLVAAVRGLLERVHAEQRSILADVVQVAVAISRNGYAWRSIARSIEGVGGQIAIVREAVGESTAGARTSEELAGAMRALVEAIRGQYDGALQSLEGALARISRITGSVREIDGFVGSMNAAAARADEIMTLIETLSSETDLLSLNAAIEAAHAGELGRGFSVIAEEIRALARSTNEATISVSQLVAKISEISGQLQNSIAAAGATTGDVAASAQRVRDAIGLLRGAFESAMLHAAEVASSASHQTRVLDRVLENINRTAGAFVNNDGSATEKGRLELAMLGSRAHAIAARRPIGTVIERVRAFGEDLCTQLEASVDSALSSGRISFETLFDFRYHAIEGNEIGSLGRLFDTSRVPATGFDPPKYATPWDRIVDTGFIDILESVYDAAAAFSPVVIFISDLNGFFYAYPRRKIAAWTNDPAADNLGNRIKRLFEDEYALRVGRWGLGPNVRTLGTRCTYDAFRQAGCSLAREGMRPWGGYVYARDTSMVCNEVVMALYARNMRHSTLRICYDPNLI